MNKIENVMLHYADGFCMRDDLSIEDMSLIMNARVRSPLIRISWMLNGRELSVDYPMVLNGIHFSFNVLPGMDGFICIGREFKPDNCVLLDVYGKERMRLSFPWHLIEEKKTDPEKPSAKFCFAAKGYKNPDTGEKGIFGLAAVVWSPHYYCSHDYYFELDWRTGKFLWGTKIRI